MAHLLLPEPEGEEDIFGMADEQANIEKNKYDDSATVLRSRLLDSREPMCLRRVNVEALDLEWLFEGNNGRLFV